MACPFAAARAYRKTGWKVDGLEASDQVGHISFASACPPSFAIAYLSGPIAFWEEALSVTLRAPIGEYYLQHSCKHFTSWPACHPRLVPTGTVDVPGISASQRVHLAAARRSRGSRLL